MELIVFVSTVIVFAIDRHSIHLISSLDKKEPIHIGLFYMLNMPDHIRDYFHSKSFTLAAIGTVFVVSILGNVYFLNTSTNTFTKAGEIEKGDFFGGNRNEKGETTGGSSWQNGQYVPFSGYPGSAQGAAPPPASGPLTIGGSIGGVPVIGNNSQPSYGNGQAAGSLGSAQGVSPQNGGDLPIGYRGYGGFQPSQNSKSPGTAGIITPNGGFAGPGVSVTLGYGGENLTLVRPDGTKLTVYSPGTYSINPDGSYNFSYPSGYSNYNNVFPPGYDPSAYNQYGYYGDGSGSYSGYSGQGNSGSSKPRDNPSSNGSSPKSFQPPLGSSGILPPVGGQP